MRECNCQKNPSDWVKALNFHLIGCYFLNNRTALSRLDKIKQSILHGTYVIGQNKTIDIAMDWMTKYLALPRVSVIEQIKFNSHIVPGVSF